MKWISVKDQLPEIGKNILLYQSFPKGTMFNALAYPLERCFIIQGGLRHDGKFVSKFAEFSHIGLDYITHWMPLPEPPRE